VNWWNAVLVVVALAVAGAGLVVARHTRSGNSPSPGRPAAGPVNPGKSTPRPRPEIRLPIGTIGHYSVSGQWFHFSRASPAGKRPLTVLVRRPVIPAAVTASGRKLAPGLFPLVVFAPGYRQCQASYTSLLSTWASAGYAVAAVQFPRTNCHVRYPDEADLANQPADVRYVISQLLTLSARPGGPIPGLIDPSQIAVAGHSDGGDTVAAVVGNTCCLDHRVKAAVVLAGAQWPPLGGRLFPRPSPPVLFVQGSADTWNPPPASEQLYEADRGGSRYYLDLPGADHFSPYEGAGRPEPVVARVTIDFLDRYVAGQDTLTAMEHAGDVAGEAMMIAGDSLPAGM
jgi:predicted dienelactone hydrolase